MKNEEPYSDACQGLIHKVFESQVRLTPNSCAVVEGDKRLTYLELNENASRVAGSLAALGVGPEELVGIYLPRSIALIVGLVGILKAGGVYVPLDPSFSKDQLAFRIKDAKLSVIVTEQNSLKQLPRTSGRLVCLDRDGLPRAVSGSPAVENPIEENTNGMSPDNLAYVCFTSGSTGVPHGVCIPHRGVVRLVRGTNYARFSSQEVFLHASTISFDASTFEIWGCLLNGGRLVIFRPGPCLVRDLTRTVQFSGVTTLWLTSALFNRVIDLDPKGLRGLRQLLIGGDILSVPHVQKALDTLERCQLINGYGPTENTTFTCCYHIHSPVQGDSIPIGLPITNTHVHILGPDGQPAFPGAVGELYIGGAGLARGYLNRPNLTSQKFVCDPFSDPAAARLYKSGDRVRHLADGNIEFVGRWDRQVKVRGFRIELDGVEAGLRRCRGVQEAAVIVNGTIGTKRMVAYIVPKPDEEPCIRDLRSATGLPDQAVPIKFALLSELPITTSGKTDYSALASLSPADWLQSPDTENGPSVLTPTQEVVRELWNEVLGVRKLGLNDDFFQAGGDSLHMVTLFELVERRFGKSLSLSDCVNARTIQGLAGVLDKRPRSNLVSLPFVVALRHSAAAERAPLFLVAGGKEDGLHSYIHLIIHLPSNLTIWGLQLPETEEQSETIESIAAHQIRSLRDVQPSGPYFLAGYCFGGLVAFEMAQQLSAQREEVRFLGIMDYPMNLFDPPKFDWTPSGLWKWTKNVAWAMQDLWDLPQSEVKRVLRRWVARAGNFCAKKLHPTGPAAESDLDYLHFLTGFEKMPEELAKRVELEFKACQDYQPRLYAGPVTLFRPRRLSVFQPYDETMGWKRIVTGRLDVCIVPGVGVHGQLMTRANAPALARMLDRSLRLAQGVVCRNESTAARSNGRLALIPKEI